METLMEDSDEDGEGMEVDVDEEQMSDYYG